MIIRRAGEADIEAIAALLDASPTAAQWPAPDLLRCECLVAATDTNIEGVVAWRTVASAEHEILNIAVRPELRGRGIGQELVKAAIASASGTWFLEVRESNDAARSLYRKMGFTEVGIRKKYYENPPEPGIVMSFCS